MEGENSTQNSHTHLKYNFDTEENPSFITEEDLNKFRNGRSTKCINNKKSLQPNKNILRIIPNLLFVLQAVSTMMRLSSVNIALVRAMILITLQ